MPDRSTDISGRAGTVLSGVFDAETGERLGDFEQTPTVTVAATVTNDDLTVIDSAAEGAKRVASEYTRWLAAAQRELDDLNAIFDFEVAVLEERRSDVTHGLHARVEKLTSLLEQFALAWRHRTEQASLELPYGKLSTTAGQKSIAINDEKLLLAWAAKQDDTVKAIVTATTEPKTTGSRSGIAAGIKAGTLSVDEPQGVVVVVATGDPVPGIRQVVGDTMPKVAIT